MRGAVPVWTPSERGRPASVTSATLHRPVAIASAACPTWSRYDDPPVSVVSIVLEPQAHVIGHRHCHRGRACRRPRRNSRRCRPWSGRRHRARPWRPRRGAAPETCPAPFVSDAHRRRQCTLCPWCSSGHALLELPALPECCLRLNLTPEPPRVKPDLGNGLCRCRSLRVSRGQGRRKRLLRPGLSL